MTLALAICQRQLEAELRLLKNEVHLSVAHLSEVLGVADVLGNTCGLETLAFLLRGHPPYADAVTPL